MLVVEGLMILACNAQQGPNQPRIHHPTSAKETTSAKITEGFLIEIRSPKLNAAVERKFPLDPLARHVSTSDEQIGPAGARVACACVIGAVYES